MAPSHRRGPPLLLDRRRALLLLGGTALAAGCGMQPEAPACTLAPALTAGPYWVDDRLDRSDLRWDTHGRASPDPRPGVPLALEIRIRTASPEGCRAVRGAQVDLWHCDAMGVYSDVPASMTDGQDFLRGYQVTGADGLAGFTTIYPGWYAGRAVHIHAKVRLFDPWGEVSTESSTQLFFDDAVSDAVFALDPYAGRGPRDTRNATDPILRGGDAPMLSLSGSPASGFQGAVELAIRLGELR